MKSKLQLTLCLAIFAGSCTSSTSPNAGTGTLVGRVLVSNYHDGTWLKDGSGVTVSIDSSGVQTTTLADGSYDLEQVPAGTHILYLSKPGYGTMKRYNIGVPGPGTVYLETFQIAEIPPMQLHIDSLVQFDRYISLFDVYYSTDDTMWAPRGGITAETRRAPFHAGDSVWFSSVSTGVPHVHDHSDFARRHSRRIN